MAFRKDKTTSANASIMTAGSVVAGLIANNEITTPEQARDAVVLVATGLFAFASPIVDADNANFEASEASEPKAAKKSSKQEASTTGDPGDTAFAGGKFKGCTIREVYEMSTETAKGTYGHQFGDGSTYIVNYVATDKNTNDITREAAKSFLASIQKAA